MFQLTRIGVRGIKIIPLWIIRVLVRAQSDCMNVMRLVSTLPFTNMLSIHQEKTKSRQVLNIQGSYHIFTCSLTRQQNSFC